MDARVHEVMLDDALSAVVGHLDDAAVRRVLDVGAGTGAATVRWAVRYPDAEVIALDADPAMAERIAARVAGEQVRIVTRPVQAMDLAAGSVDVAWASSVVHELDDPAGAFDALSQAIRPGGVLAVMEMDAPPRVLPDEHEELESRLRGLAHADAPRADWTAALESSGFDLLARSTLTSDQELPGDGIGGDYARAELSRLALHAADGLTTAQNATLSQILQPRAGTPPLPVVRIRGTRSLWISRRP